MDYKRDEAAEEMRSLQEVEGRSLGVEEERHLAEEEERKERNHFRSDKTDE
jgi:hypothetical protein